MSEYNRDEMSEDIDLRENDSPETSLGESFEDGTAFSAEEYPQDESVSTEDEFAYKNDEEDKDVESMLSEPYFSDGDDNGYEESGDMSADSERDKINTDLDTYAQYDKDMAESESVSVSDGDEDADDLTFSSKKKIKSNKPMAKKKKAALAIAISLCIVAVVLSIVLPIVFYRVPRIFVKSGDDFVAGNKVGNLNKYFYSVGKDVTCESLMLDGDNVYSIDLKGNALNVKGDFSILTDKEGVLYIGTRKSNDEYVGKKSELNASKINVDAPNLDVVIMADISCENLEINARSLTLGSFKNGEFTRVDMNISAQKVTFVGNMSGSTSSVINLSHCEEVVVGSSVNISNTINLISSNLIVEANATLATVTLDGESYATVSGNITNAIIGGKQVTMLQGHVCNTYENIETLVIFRNISVSQLIKNCKSIVYVEKLNTPMDVNIEERDSKIFCKVAGVKYASGYRYEINGEVIRETGADETEIEITDRVKDVGTYEIKVTPLGNYKSDMEMTQSGHRTMYTDGDSISVKYNCTLQLKAPTGLKIDENRVLTFESVMHAQYYFIWVDGMFVVRDDITATSEDLSKYLGGVGNHSIRVQAFNLNENILHSAVTMQSYSTTVKLEAVDEETLKANFNIDNTVINVSWQGVADGYEYIVYLQYEGNKIEVGRTSIVDEVGTIVYTINLEDFNIDFDPANASDLQVYVVAAEHDYYTNSNASGCVVRNLNAIR